MLLPPRSVPVPARTQLTGPRYVYVPFGPFIMANVQAYLARFSGHSSTIAESAEKAGLGPRTGGAKQHAVKAGRLKGQLFAYTVTNQGEPDLPPLRLPPALYATRSVRPSHLSS